MRSNLQGSPRTAQCAYQQRQKAKEVKRFAFFAFLVVLCNALFWFGVMS
jgi:hypothetical protein